MNNNDHTKNVQTKPTNDGKKSQQRLIVAGALVVAFTLTLYLVRKYLSIELLAEQETALKDYYAENPALFLAIAFFVYVITTGLSIPGAALLSLTYAWFFGFTQGFILISFASTAGATMAFLLSRYVFRDWVQNRFKSSLKMFNKALDKEGAYYLFTLRLIPLVPYFVVNAVMGLTKMKVTTFWWVSQLGMLLGTAVFVYAGSRVPDLQTLQEEGVEAIFSTERLTQFAIAFALIGLTPLILKKILGRKPNTG